MKALHPNVRRWLTFGFLLNHLSYGVPSYKLLEMHLFLTWLAVLIASAQKDFGRFDCISIALAESTRVRLRRSATPFCCMWGMWGGEPALNAFLCEVRVQCLIAIFLTVVGLNLLYLYTGLSLDLFYELNELVRSLVLASQEDDVAPSTVVIDHRHEIFGSAIRCSPHRPA